MKRLVRSETLMSDIELDEDCEVCQADGVMIVRWDKISEVGESVLQRGMKTNNY